MSRRPSKSARDAQRKGRGIVLVIVLIVVAVLSLAAYAFTDLMRAQNEATYLLGMQTQAQMSAASGVESVRAFLMLDAATQLEMGGSYDNPTNFLAVPVAYDELDSDSRSSFTVLAPLLDTQGMPAGWRYGLEDESSRLNLNALIAIEQKLNEAGGAVEDLEGAAEAVGLDSPDSDLIDTEAPTVRDLLMGVPGMDEYIADAILDWLDEDDEPREYGAEVEYYTGLTPAYAPKNGPLETVEELLLVRDITPQLLFGLDLNRNGMLDENELASGADSEMLETCPLGWSSYLTLQSKENNISSLGEPRIDLNTDDLQSLYDQLILIYPEDWVTFIIAYRQAGAYEGTEAGEPFSSGTLDLRQGGDIKFTQVLDLIGAKVEIKFQGEDEAVVLNSPFSDDPATMATYLPELMDYVTVVSNSTIPGRININTAPRDLLLGIPGLEEEAVDQIISDRESMADSGDANFEHETWLLANGIVTLDQMRTIMPFVSAGGDVYRTQVVGFDNTGKSYARLEVILDATETPARILLWRDISHLGRGYPLETLGADVAAVTVQ